MVLALLLACTSPERIKSSATANANTYAAEMGWEVAGASCSASDSDLDGDVTCNIRVKSTIEGAPDDTYAIECNHDVAWAPLGQATGCKPVVYAAGFGAAPQ